MKKLLVLSVFIPFISSAQVEISALAGGSLNIGTTKTQNNGNKRTNIAPYGSVKIAYLYKGFAFGAAADFISIKHSTPESYYDAILNKEIGGEYLLQPYKPGLNASIFANKIIEQAKSTVYFGVNAGYIFSLSGGIYFKPTDPSYPAPETKGASNGLTFGIQAGYTYRLTDKVKLKAEFAPRFLYSLKDNDYKDYDHGYNTIILPVAIGVSFTL